MNMYLHNKLMIMLLLAASLFLGACATAPNEAAEAPAEAAPVVEIEPWDGDGMQIPMDGSSMEAWDRSMARVKAHTSEPNYITFENSIKYLLMYDLKSYRDMNKLIVRLDGQTPYEIISKVGWRKPAPGMGPAEKGSADAKIPTS